MLILTRRPGESIMIQLYGKLIEVMVTKINKGQVSIGFGADQDVLINREEIYNKIQMEKKNEHN